MRIGTIIAVGAVALIGGAFAWKEYTRQPAAASDGKVEHSVTAEQLYADFQQDDTAAQLKYVGMSEQVIEVTGVIRDIDANGAAMSNVILETGDPLGGIVCEFSEGAVPETWQAGSQVSIRGFCQGMLMDVILQRCVAVQ